MAVLNQENCSPGTSKIVYPDISQHPFLGNALDSGHKFDQPPRKKGSTPSVPANIGRRRSTHSSTHSVDLINSPPRASYSTNITSIFANARNGQSMEQKRAKRIGETPLSIERRDSVTEHTDRHQLLSPLSRQDSIGIQADSDEDPLQDLEDPVNLPSPSMPPVTLHPVDESSDEWTGDEMFIPRPTRTRYREERLAKRKMLQERQALSSELPGRQVYSPKPSRFQSMRPEKITHSSPPPESAHKSPEPKTLCVDEKLKRHGESRASIVSSNERRDDE